MRCVADTLKEVVEQYALQSCGESLKERQTSTGVKDAEVSYWGKVANPNVHLDDTTTPDRIALELEALSRCNQLLRLKGIIFYAYTFPYCFSDRRN